MHEVNMSLNVTTINYINLLFNLTILKYLYKNSTDKYRQGIDYLVV
jgi:hypothetical protein